MVYFIPLVKFFAGIFFLAAVTYVLVLVIILLAAIANGE